MNKKFKVYYTNSAYKEYYNGNCQSSFRNNIDLSNLRYLPPSEKIEAALVNISFSLKERIDENLQLGVRSSILKDSHIRGTCYDNIIYVFTILKSSSKLSVNYEIPPTQHVYFETTIERLAKAKFEIIKLQSNELFSEINNSQDETFIELSVQTRNMDSFSVLVESNDEESRKKFTKNNNMSFISSLPHQMSLQGQIWTVLCKGLQCSGSIFNVQDESFSIQFKNGVYRKKLISERQSLKIDQDQHIFYSQYFENVNGGFDPSQYFRRQITLQADEYEGVDEIIKIFNQDFLEQNINFLKFILKEGKCELKSRFQFDESKFSKQKSYVTLSISPQLSKLFGYIVTNNSSSYTEFNLLYGRKSFVSENNYQIINVKSREEIQLETSSDLSFYLPPNSYKTRSEVINFLNNQLQLHGVKVYFTFQSDKIFLINSYKVSGDYSITETFAQLILSSNLSMMLGFSIDKSPCSINMMSTKKLESQFSGNFNVGLPTTLLVHLNIIESSLVGKIHMPVIQTLHLTRYNILPSILHFVVKENNPVLISTKVFSQLNVKITNISGELIKSKNDYPTIIYFSFIRWDN